MQDRRRSPLLSTRGVRVGSRQDLLEELEGRASFNQQVVGQEQLANLAPTGKEPDSTHPVECVIRFDEAANVRGLGWVGLHLHTERSIHRQCRAEAGKHVYAAVHEIATPSHLARVPLQIAT